MRSSPSSLELPARTLSSNLEVSAARHPERAAIAFFGREIDYRRLEHEANACAGWLQKRAGVKPGDRVALYMQNSPQWLIAFYGALRADAVVVPVNPMNRAGEVKRVVEDSGAQVVVASQELAEAAVAAAPAGLRAIVVTAYADYLPARPEFDLPGWITESRPAIDGCVPWAEVVSGDHAPLASSARPDDLAVLNYTSGSSGQPKGCMHTHRTFMHSVAGLARWHDHAPGTVFLGAAPMHQIAGLTNGVNCAIYVGGTVVPLPRWDRTLAAGLIARHRIGFAHLPPAAIGDLLASPDIDRYDLASVTRISCGGSTMPRAVWHRVRERFGLPFIEVYGMTETGTILINPIERPRPQCLGVPFFDTDVRVIDPESLAPRGVGEAGELVMRGPQLFRGYWHDDRATAEATIEIEGQRYFRTGDIGRVDEDGYFFMTDRLKRMINAAGHKVWPAEVEALLQEHPDVLEACVVGARDRHRGETVKALIVLRPGGAGRVLEADLIDWTRERMAVYKCPRRVEFVDALPKSPAGKILWREIQERDNRGA